jgi:hypothetical protein
MALTRERLCELLDYDPATGVLTWKVTRKGGASRGEQAGWIETNGYRRLTVERRRYPAHHLIWMMVYGVWPPQEIDHKNRVRHDNRLSNLRLATRAQNLINTGKWSTNTSGFKGAYRPSATQKWRALISIDGKQRCLGYFATAEEAAAAYSAAAEKHYGEFAEAVKQ